MINVRSISVGSDHGSIASTVLAKGRPQMTRAERVSDNDIFFITAVIALYVL